MTSSVKMPSSVVPIDISGQSFSRMASFRRSLIHVDFFIRRKKKDKRRNTVAEGDTKELKNTLQNIINEERNILPNGNPSKKFFSNGMHKPAIENNIIKKVSIQETNNNFPKNDTAIKESSEKETLKRNCYLEQDKVLQKDKIKVELKNSHNSEVSKSYINKKKPKSNLPISTVSAAMNVAVEMRQLNGKDYSSTNNWSDHNSSDSDSKKSSYKDKSHDHLAINGEDSGFSDNFKNRSKDNYKVLNAKIATENEDTEAFSSASSENNTMQDDETSNATSLESDAFLMSSDEDSLELLVQKYGSSTSLSTMSDGSLNSLLSQTGTEMVSSTGTLTSIGQERFPTPPPPFVTPKIEIISDTVPVFTKTNINAKNLPSPKHETSAKVNKGVILPKKSSKYDKLDQRKSSTDSNKSIFTSLVSKKSRTKEPCKDISLCTKSTMHLPCFDMYGNNSPQKIPRSSIFGKESIQPLLGSDHKSYLQSFLPTNNSKPEKDNKNKLEDKNVQKDVFLNEISTASISNLNTQKSDTEIPLKYAHHVVVTPISRKDENKKYFYRKSLFSGPELENEHALKSHYHSQPKSKNIESVTQKPQRPNTLQTQPKTAARVLLDPEGRVIYTTNSLDRRLPYGHPNHFPPSTINIKEKYINSHYPINLSENIKHNVPLRIDSSPHSKEKQNDKNTRQQNIHPKSLENSRFNDSSQQTYFCNSINKTENFALVNESNIKSSNSSEASAHSKTPPSYEEAVGKHCPLTVKADPNISGLPTIKTMLTEENIHLHLENIERLNKMHLEFIADSYKSLISPQANISSPLDSNISKLQKSTMSTEDLFAVIHDCKKRMNIKTDSDISLASSSRSSSPSFLKPNQTKSILAETGFLSPRNSSNYNNGRDRRSWADFRPANNSPNERKSLASDRLGRTKPTSMHDFKMLLLQARSTAQISGPRKSAVEMLKVSQSPNDNVLLSPSSSHYVKSFSVQSSPTSPSYIYNGHSTVPFKRHNNRVRSSLQSRYTMYPPIFEDCSEEAEIRTENVTKSFT